MTLLQSKKNKNKILVSHFVMSIHSIVNTTGPVLIREVSLFQRLIRTQKYMYTIGTSETALTREVSFKRGPTVHEFDWLFVKHVLHETLVGHLRERNKNRNFF